MVVPARPARELPLDGFAGGQYRLDIPIASRQTQLWKKQKGNSPSQEWEKYSQTLGDAVNE
jgi:hypothetical protein